MSDHEHVIAARRAEGSPKAFTITTEEYLAMRLNGKGASLGQMFACKWASVEEIVEILLTTSWAYPGLINSLKSEVCELLLSDFCTQELTDAIYVNCFAFFPMCEG